MPYQSKSQMRLFFAKEKRGELPEGTARKWAHETKSIKALPQYKGRKRRTRITRKNFTKKKY